MGEVSTIGVDIAKSVFQVHGVDADGTVVIRRRVGRAKVLEFFSKLRPCLVGMTLFARAVRLSVVHSEIIFPTRSSRV